MQKILLVSLLIATTSATAQFAMPPTKVSAITTAYTVYQPSLQSTGTLSAAQGVIVQPETSGRISKIYFNSGDFVKEGTPLVELNNDIIKAELSLNQANLELSEHDFQRKQELLQKHVVSKSDMDAAQATLKINQARVAGTKAQLAQTIIKAAFAGRLGLNQVSVGDYVTPATKIVTLQAVNPISIDFSIPETNVTQLAIGQEVQLTDEAYINKIFRGKIKAFEAVMNQNAQSLTVRAEVPNADLVLIPGTFMHVTVLTGIPQKVITIPQTALLYDAEGNYVYRVINKKAVRTKVTTGIQTKQAITITKGLAAGEQVITAGQIKLQNGSDVDVVKI
ncbi:MAG: efflux RND transporter periplasmic adaptor subunit [Pseudomonadota bacterium]|nr:efflux RND transporter periplasmic adaptor subunit [Pseudomonadota bacterium]